MECPCGEGEVWKPIPGFEGHYEASTCGRIRSLTKRVTTKGGWTQTHRGRIRATVGAGPSGYPYVPLWKGGRQYMRPVHRLVALTFHGSPAAGQEVAHRNGDIHDSHASNLRWATHQENEADKASHGTRLLGTRHPQARLTEFAVLDARARRKAGASISSLAREYGVNGQTMADAISGKSWGWLSETPLDCVPAEVRGW